METFFVFGILPWPSECFLDGGSSELVFCCKEESSGVVEYCLGGASDCCGICDVAEDCGWVSMVVELVGGSRSMAL